MPGRLRPDGTKPQGRLLVLRPVRWKAITFARSGRDRRKERGRRAPSGSVAELQHGLRVDIGVVPMSEASGIQGRHQSRLHHRPGGGRRGQEPGQEDERQNQLSQGVVRVHRRSRFLASPPLHGSRRAPCSPPDRPPLQGGASGDRGEKQFLPQIPSAAKATRGRWRAPDGRAGVGPRFWPGRPRAYPPFDHRTAVEPASGRTGGKGAPAPAITRFMAAISASIRGWPSCALR